MKLILLMCAAVAMMAVPEFPQDVPIRSLRYIGKYNVPHHKMFQGTTIGGLSGIDYDVKNDLYYLICDDRSALQPARFYTARIFFHPKGVDSIQFNGVHSLLGPDGQVYPNSKTDPKRTPDPEAIRYNAATMRLVWTSEGERIISDTRTVLQHPSLTEMTTDGMFTDSIPAPPNTFVHNTENGPRQNGGFEGLSFSTDLKNIFYGVELPRYEDGPEATTGSNLPYVRIYKNDMATKQNVSQYAYLLEPVAFPAEPASGFTINGLVDMLAIGDNQLLTLERSFSTGRLACTVKIFIADLAHASDIKEIASLKQSPPPHPIKKKLLLNMDDLGIYIDNVEGMTFGPTLANGHRTLIFISDDNFNPLEITQILAFEIE